MRPGSPTKIGARTVADQASSGKKGKISVNPRESASDKSHPGGK